MCPCGSGLAYSECCRPLHGGGAADTAEALMRSRFSAFVLGLDGYLLASWHPETRPTTLELDAGVTWRRLQIVDTVGGGATDATGIVEFRASFRDRAADVAGADAPAGAAGLLHERSRFERFDDRWVYVDGDIFE